MSDTSPNQGQVLHRDTIVRLTREEVGAVVVCGSHAGIYAGYCAALGQLRGVILNDVGVGKDGAGVASLPILSALGMPAAAVDKMSAMVANGLDTIDHGIVSHVNEAAEQLGCRVGQSARDAAQLMTASPWPHKAPVPLEETRVTIESRAGKPIIVGCDSASLIRDEDVGRIVVAGSHCALLGGKRDDGVRPLLHALVLSDAGIGKNRAGVARLPYLDERGIAAAAASVQTCHIGSWESIYSEGVLSTVNESASGWGIRPGMTVKEFVAIALGKLPS